MKKFGEVLRLISSVLLASVVRDSDALARSLHVFFDSTRHTRFAFWIAEAVPPVIVALFLRNIHGSARYDDYLEKRGYLPSFERRLRGRMVTFCLAIGALFGGPYLADHILGSHLNPIREPAPSGNSAPSVELWLDPQDAVPLSGVILFTPLLLYAVWDALIWLSDRQPDAEGGPLLQDVATRWLKVDAAAALVVVGIAVYGLYCRASFRVFEADLNAGAFVFVAVGVIVADYLTNAKFYFQDDPVTVVLSPEAGKVAPNMARRGLITCYRTGAHLTRRITRRVKAQRRRTALGGTGSGTATVSTQQHSDEAIRSLSLANDADLEQLRQILTEHSRALNDHTDTLDVIVRNTELWKEEAALRRKFANETWLQQLARKVGLKLRE